MYHADTIYYSDTYVMNIVADTKTNGGVKMTEMNLAQAIWPELRELILDQISSHLIRVNVLLLKM